MSALVSVDWVRLMARYGAWQNEGHMEAVAAMGDDALRRPRGAFFGSIMGTLNHLLWADRIWMHRLAGTERPPGGIGESVDLTPDASEWRRLRIGTDASTLEWADGLADADLAGDLTWHSGVLGRDISKPRALCVAHLFNHQTHHRGQVHAMMTAAGVSLRDTDIPFMPDP